MAAACTDPCTDTNTDVSGGVGAARADGGYTLIEALISIALLGVVVVPMIAAMGTSIRVSSTAKSVAQVESALLSAADRVNRAPLRCDYDQYAQAAVQTQGWAADRASTTTVWFDPAARAWAVDDDGCRFDSPTMDLVQRVEIFVTSPDGTISRSIEVVKSRV